VSEPTPVVEERIGFVEAFVRQLRLIWLLLRDERVSLLIKAVPVATVLYALFPIDFLPDIFPPLGQIDDIAALILGFSLFVELAPPDIVREHQRELAARPVPQLEEGEETNER
jgi:uncharacterized membrane protein YkvA (DUF1232 family)